MYVSIWIAWNFSVNVWWYILNEVQCHTTVLGYLVTTLDIPWLNSKLDIIPSHKDKPKYMYSFQVQCATYIGVCLYEVLLMTYLVFCFIICLLISLKAINQFWFELESEHYCPHVDRIDDGVSSKLWPMTWFDAMENLIARFFFFWISLKVVCII